MAQDETDSTRIADKANALARRLDRLSLRDPKFSMKAHVAEIMELHKQNDAASAEDALDERQQQTLLAVIWYAENDSIKAISFLYSI